MLGEARTGARAHASPSMLIECSAPYGTSLAELTIAISSGPGRSVPADRYIQRAVNILSMCPDDTATAGSWAGVGLVD
jgi:hypothetical protein